VKRLIDIEHIDYIITELMFIRGMVTDGRAHDRLSELLEFVETDLLDPDRDTRNELKRSVYRKMKNAETPEESKAWHEVYQNINKVFSQKKE